MLMKSNSNSIAVFLVVALLLAISQRGWTQHDYGHLSVFNKRRWNHYLHYIVICHIKGASSRRWNFCHFQHHVKPNIIRKDPDIAVAKMFLLGEVLPRIWGRKKRSNMPYHWQHWCFWLIGPPLLLLVYFHLEYVYFVIKWRLWVDLLWMSTFFLRFFCSYGSMMGGWRALALYMLMRLLESYWFVLVTQMNHIPMAVDKDHSKDLVTMQFKATCNIEGSLFNDWFMGGLNYQIEHHLLPTMPRHNLPEVALMVKELASKHKLVYLEKSLVTGMLDIHRSLKRSGQIWWDSYNLA